MKKIGHLEKWVGGALGIVCAVLVIRLAWRPAGSRVGAARPIKQTGYSPEAPGHRTVAHRSSEDAARYDPVVKLDLLKALQARPLRKFARNPFEFEAPPRLASPPPVAAGASSTTAAVAPVPPPLPLKPLGYSEKPGGVREGLVSDDEQVYVVHEGDIFAKRFRVVKITPAAIEIEDESFHQTVQLPFSQ